VIYYPTIIARYSLFVLKVPLNPKQTNKVNLRTSNVWRFSQYYDLDLSIPQRINHLVQLHSNTVNLKLFFTFISLFRLSRL